MKIETDSGANLESVDWTQVDHVLLDMDGTLLDLAFDNDFWGHRIHEKYAAIHRISVDQAEFRPNQAIVAVVTSGLAVSDQNDI